MVLAPSRTLLCIFGTAYHTINVKQADGTTDQFKNRVKTHFVQLMLSQLISFISVFFTEHFLTPILKQLHWLPISHRNIFKLMLIVLKPLHL